jgi:hypothetical protein
MFFFYKVQIMMINPQNDDFVNKLSNFWTNMDTFSKNIDKNMTDILFNDLILSN